MEVHLLTRMSAVLSSVNCNFGGRGDVSFRAIGWNVLRRRVHRLVSGVSGGRGGAAHAFSDPRLTRCS